MRCTPLLAQSNCMALRILEDPRLSADVWYVDKILLAQTANHHLNM